MMPDGDKESSNGPCRLPAASGRLTKSPKRAPFPDCRRRRKESLINGLGVEQAFAVAKNQSETPHVVSYNGLRRTLSLALPAAFGAALGCQRVDASGNRFAGKGEQFVKRSGTRRRGRAQPVSATMWVSSSGRVPAAREFIPEG